MHREPHPLDAASAERLLAGQPIAGQDRLAQLLAAMAAPAQDDELGRQAATRLAFLDARRVPVPAWRRRLSLIRSVLARGLTVKFAVVCLVAGGTSGVALAAGTGNLPDPIQRHLPGYAAPSASASHAVPPYALLAACRRYQNHDRGQRRGALQHEADLGDLVAVLGAPDELRADRFCADLRQAWPEAAASGQPTPDAATSPTAGPHQSGNGNGQGNGAGTGNGAGAGSGTGNGASTGSGNGPGAGSGTGTGAGTGAGSGTGAGTGSGTGNGGGSGAGSGSGNGAGSTSISGASPARSGNRTGAPSTQPGNRAPTDRP